MRKKGVQHLPIYLKNMQVKSVSESPLTGRSLVSLGREVRNLAEIPPPEEGENCEYILRCSALNALHSSLG
jgi:hypothetical protein